MGSGKSSTVLRGLIERHPWTWHEFVDVYDAAARELGEDTALSMRQLGRWMSGELTGLPQPAARRVLRRIFGRPVEQLFAAATDQGLHGDGAGPSERVLVVCAAHQSRDHAMEMGAFEMSTDALDELRDDVARLAHSYHQTAPTVLLSEALRVRDQVYRLLERARRPAHTADLYLVAGQACALMAAASFDLGYPSAAEDQARAAYTYGELVDYSPLRAWCRGLQAEAAYWTGRPRRALSLIESGLAEAPAGSAQVPLCSIQARAWSYLGEGPPSESLHPCTPPVELATQIPEPTSYTTRSAGTFPSTAPGRHGARPRRMFSLAVDAKLNRPPRRPWSCTPAPTVPGG